MVTRSRYDAVPRSNVVDADLAGLLRLILERSGRHDLPAPREDFGGHEIVLDLDVDDLHYMLVRRRVQPAHAPIALSPREREIALLIAQGLPNKTIAAVLKISLWTVATYVRRLFAKLGVSSRAEMVACVMTDGLLRPEG
jgi:DNA-binding CsgD family transcriptional regulator